MNMNELARKISAIEGKKRNVDIAQIKEVLQCLAQIMECPEALNCFLAYVFRRNR